MSSNRDYKNIIIGVLGIIIVILCVLLFLVWKSKVPTDNTNVPTNETVEKVANIPEVEEEIKSLNEYLSYLYPLNNPNDIANQKKLYFLMDYLPNAVWKGFSKDEGDNALLKFFGPDFSVNYEDLICIDDNEVILKYDGARYTRVGNHGHGDHLDGMIISKTQETTYSKEKDEYYVKALYLEIDDLEGAGYIDDNTYVDFYGDDEENLNEIKNNGYRVISADEYLESIKDTLSPITYTYKLNNGNYYLVNVK